jgi:hypothetical protein
MSGLSRKYSLTFALAAGIWVCNGQIAPGGSGFLMAATEARVGRPVTPISYAGVARRSTVRREVRDVDARPLDDGVGGPASGIGVLPGAGAGKAGIGYSGGVGRNLGGPVNRVGVR